MTRPATPTQEPSLQGQHPVRFPPTPDGILRGSGEVEMTDPRFVPGPDSPAWLAAMGEMDHHIERRLEYEAFLEAKRKVVGSSGFEVSVSEISERLFPFQRDIVRWALQGGKRAVFAATGLGKTPIQLEWARLVSAHAEGPVIILAPLAVAVQTKNLAPKFGIEVNYCRRQSEVRAGLNITNYDMLEHFDCSEFAGVVCDESSVMKDWTAATTQALATEFERTPYKLCCTATPSPNDHTELGTHAEFLGIMTRMEMLSMYFCHDGGNTSEWRLKGHARKPFWRWMASWAVSLEKPSDLGYSDEGYDLPKLNIIQHTVTVDHSVATEGMLFRCPDLSAAGLHKEMRLTADDRAAKVAELIASEPEQPWIVWCNTEYEAKALRALLPQLSEVKGSDSVISKENALMGFASGEISGLLSKPSICGHGMNFQRCARMAFVGLSYSWEQLYQAIRRCWRYGQARPVEAHIVIAETEGKVLEKINQKEAKHEELQREMVEAMREVQLEERGKIQRSVPTGRSERGEMWEIQNDDCVTALQGCASDSIHYTIFSPPFASLYVYSDSDADMGNCKSEEEFFEHFRFLIEELHRVTMPGRLVSVHCIDLPMTIERDGATGLKDFSGEIIRQFEKSGFIYHSRVCIWKDPLVAATRTKALGLLHKQLVKDSSRSRQGIPDYLITFRKPGENPEPIAHAPAGFEEYKGTLPPPAQARNSDPQRNGYSHIIWQRYASPVWMDIDPSDTLQRESARQEEDERHIAPLQLGVIERGMELWSNPGDLVLDPYAGIGSTGVVCARSGRRFLGVELKQSYFEQAVANLKEAQRVQSGLFADL